MPLPIAFRVSVRRAIKMYVDDLIKQQVKPNPQASQKWKYTNSADYHYGHFVGFNLMNSQCLYKEFYHKQITVDEGKEIEEIIEELGKPFREYLQSLSD